MQDFEDTMPKPDFKSPRPRLSPIGCSREHETKTLVSRTTSLMIMKGV